MLKFSQYYYKIINHYNKKCILFKHKSFIFRNIRKLLKFNK